MKLTIKERAQIEDLIARGEVKLWAAGADLSPNSVTPVSFTELVTLRRTNIGKRHG